MFNNTYISGKLQIGFVLRLGSVVLFAVFSSETAIANPISLDQDLANFPPGGLVRLGYLVPTNRTPQPNAVKNLQGFISGAQAWYSDQMQRNGFGPKTFRYETESDGVTPKIHAVQIEQTDAFLRGRLFDRTISSAQGAGLPVWSSNQVWLLLPETHVQAPDGSATGGAFLGRNINRPGHPGVGLTSSGSLPWLGPSTLTDKRTYDGLIVPEIGPYPLVQGVSYPSFSGSTIGQISSAGQGGTAHELGHGFGLSHDFRNDRNAHGNLMGNGLRGWGHWFAPEHFPQNQVRLSYGSALALNWNQYFNADSVITDQIDPQVTVLTTGQVDPVNGLLEVQFTSTDNVGLAAVHLKRNGNTVAETTLHGTSVATTLTTPYYVAGQTDSFAITVYDQQGNRTITPFSLTVNTGSNAAPRPFIETDQDTLHIGDPVLLDASRTIDPDDNLSLVTVEWDLNGDLQFDTPPVVDKTWIATFDTSGSHRIYARLTDPKGAKAISAPIHVWVIPEPRTLFLLISGGAILWPRKERLC